MTFNACPESQHEAMKRDDAVWRSLPYKTTTEPDDDIPAFEVRNCHCHSTLYREVVRS